MSSAGCWSVIGIGQVALEEHLADQVEGMLFGVDLLPFRQKHHQLVAGGSPFVQAHALIPASHLAVAAEWHVGSGYRDL